ncbi:putative metalloprotease with PDZ domain [Pontibacter ummariensis]|uniref:Predicted metalloprotease, contains C-terminal PDZ domain n=1 Tax=Pontibacter ummariensis TaxID=1610492 RepID=A0A239BIG4_9BACT|nr:PDZ domain-containing protein [Pontibacter ummariensis]PRY16531.1 putative metalloprotease with PDZ domain [Pontibacter ummariensis]SNS06833.1 Predicted metalloprotease, contains C-terminal PDZ domain [Pontibacter ummariensis]
MKHTLYSLLGLAVALVSQPVLAQQKVGYRLSFPNAVHHEAEIQATFSDVTSDTLKVLMPRTSPGRYAIHEFAKNVYNVRATDAQGKPLQIFRPNTSEWDVIDHNGTVNISYTLFADHPDGTYAGVDETHAHLNMPATLMYAKGFEKAPAYVTFQIPEGKNWKVATQLKKEQGNTYYAPNFQYLMDSPTELSDFDLAEWTVNENGKTKTIQVAMHHPGTDAQFQEYVAKTKKIVAEQRAVYGQLPDYDFGRYTFVACYMPQAVGDGMEHRNSTILTSSRPLSAAMSSLLNTVSHEKFHAWNVERIRPKALEPFNFQEANMSDALWLAEGFTSYYGDMTMARSGIFDIKKYASDLAGDLNYVLLSPGRQYHSLAEMSMQAPFVDAARSVDPVNRHNTFVSYYTYGSMTGLALDMILRQQYDKTLDDYMQALWRKYGAPEKPYTLADLEETLAEVSGDKTWASSFFRNSIYGSQLPDFAPLLAKAGLELRKAKPGEATIGMVALNFGKEGAALASGTLVNSAAYEAGLDRTDIILTLDGQKIRTEKDLKKVLRAHKPGDSLPITFNRLGETREATIVLDEVPTLEVVPYESIGKQLTPEMERYRQAWLGSKAVI